MEKIKLPTNRNFGIVFFVVFLIISLFPLLIDGNLRIWSAIISAILSPLNKIWFKFGILLGSFISPIVMGLIFFTIVTPTALILRAFGKNLLQLKKNDKKVYWIKKNDIKSDMKNQF